MESGMSLIMSAEQMQKCRFNSFIVCKCDLTFWIGSCKTEAYKNFKLVSEQDYVFGKSYTMTDVSKYPQMDGYAFM